ncbi:hypothetical protein [Beijerinckia sp. L45]|uniref:hypothetical protein n=1 Tax=Beijerinckia sp. L45 TaxID=1641855 RepID=UPI00131C51DA|nr:hypothetical protein [Beijerinckia sp. L45]
MTKLMDDAIASLREDVPPEHQDDIARAVMQLTGKAQRVYRLTQEERADLDAADREIADGDFATNDEVRAVWAKHGL